MNQLLNQADWKNSKAIINLNQMYKMPIKTEQMHEVDRRISDLNKFTPWIINDQVENRLEDFLTHSMAVTWTVITGHANTENINTYVKYNNLILKLYFISLYFKYTTLLQHPLVRKEQDAYTGCEKEHLEFILLTGATKAPEFNNLYLYCYSILLHNNTFIILNNKVTDIPRWWNVLRSVKCKLASYIQAIIFKFKLV